MEFKKPEDVEEGPVWKGESSGNESSKSGDRGDELVEWQVANDDEPMLMEVVEAVELASEMLADPEAFGIAKNKRVRDLEAENEELREMVEQQREAIADLAQAVEALGSNQADMAGISEGSSVVLNSDAFGDIYEPLQVGEFGD
jgi:hypothetical protein